MKSVGALLLAFFLLVSCQKEEKKRATVIKSNELCKLLEIKNVEEIVGKKLIATPSKKQFDYARNCSYTNESGFLTLFFNERGHNLAYFAPPSSLFESEIKELPNEPNPAIAVIGKKERNTIELLVNSNRRVVALSFFNVDAKDGSKN